MTQIEEVFDWLSGNQWAEQTFAWGTLLLLAVLSYYIAKAIVGPVVRKAIKRSAFTWDDILFNEKALSRLELFVPPKLGCHSGDFGAAGHLRQL